MSKLVDTFNKVYRYLKGVYEAKFFDAEQNLRYYDNKLTDSNIASSVNMGEITAGIGNPTVIALPDSAKFNVTLTAADIDLRSRQLQTGGVLGYNGITDVCEIVTATGTELTVSATPVAPYGSDRVVCFVNGEGTAYDIDPAEKTVSGFSAEAGKTYAVRYYVAKAASEVLDIKTLFSPEIGRLEIKMPVFAAPVGAAASTGTLCGYWHVIAPRFQFGGEAGVNTNPTTAATSSLSGQALSFDDPNANGCSAGTPSLVYMVYEPVDPTEGIESMAVIGGGLELKAGESAQVPVKFVMSGGMLAQPDFTALTYQSSSESVAKVSESGLVTAQSAGDCDITVKCAEPALEVTVPVSVTA